MVRSVIFLVYFLVISLDSSESTTMECKNQYNTWNIVGSLYTCTVSKGITITSLDTAYVNSTSGSHQNGHNNDNVNYFCIHSVTISYFPRGLDGIFKNLKGIRFYETGFKEIHQSDLKPFPKLIQFSIHTNQIEILEEGLFDFNSNLEYINLHINKITHIDLKVFDSLPKLTHLYLSSNSCIDKYAEDRTAVENLIKEVKTICNNSDYSILDQKLKFLESESKSLNFNDFKVELENLESKINASKFINFYQTKLRSLKIILNEKSVESKNCSTLKVKFLNFITNLKNLTAQVSKEIENVIQESNNEATINQQCMSLNDSFVNINNNVEKIDEKIVNLSENIFNLNQTLAKIEEQISNLIEKVESESKATHVVIQEAINKAVEKIEKNLMEKLNENLKEISKKTRVQNLTILNF